MTKRTAEKTLADELALAERKIEKAQARLTRMRDAAFFAEREHGRAKEELAAAVARRDRVADALDHLNGELDREAEPSEGSET